MNDARDVSSAAFKIDRVQNHNYDFKAKNNFTYLLSMDHAIPVNIYIGVDLAATASETSDYQAILVIAIDSEKNRYVLEYFRKRIPTFDVPEKIIEIAKKYHPIKSEGYGRKDIFYRQKAHARDIQRGQATPRDKKAG